MSIFQSKNKKITDYLNKKNNDLTAFDLLLKDYLNGKLKDKFSECGVSEIEIHIDWLADYKCINIQGIYDTYCLDVQIEENHFLFAYDEDEPENHSEYPLSSSECFYQDLKNLIHNINNKLSEVINEKIDNT